MDACGRAVGADIAKNGYATQRSKVPTYRVLSGRPR